MLFTQPIFALFFAATFAYVWATRKNRRRKLALLVASYVFYAAWDWRFLSLILVSTLVDFVAARRIDAATHPRQRRGWLRLSLVVNLGLLGFFKYFNFFIDSAASILEPLGINTQSLDIVLPVGISFFTFQTLSYTLDVYRKRLRPVSGLADFALFVAFFPQLVAGPIVRAADFLPQLAHSPRWRDLDTRLHLTRFLLGFVKKACIADSLAPHVDAVFAQPGLYAASAVWIAVLLYAIQIYGDFSGYSDMAIATAGLLGYELGINFDFPYLSPNLSAFWHRWHISLSSWLRDYLYIPLGGSRGSRLATARNLMITMLLGGLWHGAAWTFVAWGAVHGVGLCVHRLWRQTRASQIAFPGARLLATALTAYTVCCAWILFRAPSFGHAFTLLESFVSLRSPGTLRLDPWLFALVAALAAVHALAHRGGFERRLARIPDPVFATAFGIAAALALSFVPLRSTPFIYFQF